MDSIKLRELKTHPQYQMLNNDLINEINSLFSLSNIKTKKRTGKKSNNILKNNKFQINKNKLENKLILILNKVSNDNVEQLVVEYLSNINVKNSEDYDVIQQEMYCKLVKDIKFINNYYSFMKNIFKINKYKLGLYPEYFIKILEYKVNYDYNNISIPEKFSFLANLNSETDRINNLKLLKYLINNNFFNKDLENTISTIIVNQNKYIPDIYMWFNNNKEVNNYSELIKNHIKSCISNNNLRNKILLESLIYDKNDDGNIEIELINSEEENTTDVFTVQVQNMIDEYLYIKSIEEIIEFIKDECHSAIDKNIFCKIVLMYYFNTTDNTPDDFLNLLDALIKKKILYKSNLSRGLINFTDNYSIQDEYRIKKLLLYLKANNITKNIEYIFKKYNIRLYYSTK